METELVAQMNGLMGFKKGDGILSPGGALGNLFALMAARQKLEHNYIHRNSYWFSIFYYYCCVCVGHTYIPFAHDIMHNL